MSKATFRNLWYNLSSTQRFFVRKVYYLPIDFFDKVIGKREKYVPPGGLIYTGSSAGA